MTDKKLLTTVEWLRIFAQDLEESEILPYECVQNIRKIAKYVDEREQCNRDMYQHILESQDVIKELVETLDKYEEREKILERIVSLQERQLKVREEYGRITGFR